jgi:linoleoyl-CoA desaturase
MKTVNARDEGIETIDAPGESFAVAIQRRVNATLDPRVLSDAYRRLHNKAVVVAIWYIASYVLLVIASGWIMGIVACASFALAMTAVGFNIQHDANHNALYRTSGSKRFTIPNRIAGWSMYALGASSKRWIEGHVFTHHSSTNIVGKDYDIELRPFARLAPSQPRRVMHRYQHLYVWMLYGFTAVSIIMADIVGIVTESFTGDRHGHRPSTRDYVVLLGTKVLFIGATVVVPLLFHPWWIVAIGVGAVLTVTGLLLGVVFQLAHVVAEAEFADGLAPDDVKWHEWQVRASADFCHGSSLSARMITWYTGGLNYQTEHHLFPQLPHTAYPAIATVVETTCATYDIRYSVQPTLRAAIASHYRHLRALGRADLVPSTAMNTRGRSH